MSSTEYARDVIRLSIAKILHTIGYHTSNTSPLDILADIGAQYIRALGRMTNDYANLYNFSEANLDHLGLAFNHFHINLPELEEYIASVDMGGPPMNCPNFPVPKENHLNFLKPGSKECITRPIHIHEHLPPMYCMNEVMNESESEPVIEEQVMDEKQESPTVFKRPNDIPSDNFKRPRLVFEEEGRPTREISSVIMTTSGFISPAREGKLPESRTPLAPIEPAPAGSTAPPPVAPAPIKVKAPKKTEKKKEKVVKEQLKSPEEKPKKPPAKEPKVKSVGEKINNIKTPNPIGGKVNKPPNPVPKVKPDKWNVTVTPVIPPAPVSIPEPVKLFSEPDRKKANIFRKISVKAENKKILKEERPDSRDTSPLLVIDEPYPESPINKLYNLNSITVEPIPKPEPKPPVTIIPKEERYFSDDSPPGTPLTPKTPEMVSHSPPLTKEKKRKEKSQKSKKILKGNVEGNDFDVNARPKTPELHDMFQPIQFPVFPTAMGPGLIPQAPLFPGIPLSIPGLPRMRPPYPSPMISPNLMDISAPTLPPPIVIEDDEEEAPVAPKHEKKIKDHKKEKKDKVKKKNKKDKVKDKAEKKKLKEEKREKIKKEKKEKKKDKEQRDTDVLVPKLTLKLGSPAPSVSTESDRKLNIKPIVKRETEEPRTSQPEPVREVSPELAKISALVTGQPKPKLFNPIKEEIPEDDMSAASRHQGPGRPRVHPVKQKPVKAHKQPPQPPPAPIKDAEGNEVWICPACGKQDDGSPMIGCDDCDAWYHWVCVGIQVPPDANENWYCRHCLAKKQEVHQSDKKKKRKKREKKDVKKLNDRAE